MDGLSEKTLRAARQVVAELRADTANLNAPMEAHLTHRVKAAGVPMDEVRILQERLGILCEGEDSEPHWSWSRTNEEAADALEALLSDTP